MFLPKTITFSSQERGKAFGIVGSIVASALAFGPTIGGLISNCLGWRLVFFINLPLGLVAIIGSSIIIRKDSRVKRQRFDLVGAGTAFFSQLALLLALSRGQFWGWDSPAVVSLFIGGAVLIVAFIIIEYSVKEPMLDLSLFKNHLFSIANVAALFNFMTQFSITFLMPFYFEKVRHLPPSSVGVILSASPLVILFVAPVSGYLTDRIGSRLLSSLGMSIIATSIFLLSWIDVNTSYVQIALFLSLMGLGVGLFQSPNSTAIMNSAPRQGLGMASSILASMRNMGMVMGVAISGAVFQTTLPIHTSYIRSLGLSGSKLEAVAFVAALKNSLWVAVVIAIMGVFVSLSRGSSFIKTVNKKEKM